MEVGTLIKLGFGHVHRVLEVGLILQSLLCAVVFLQVVLLRVLEVVIGLVDRHNPDSGAERKQDKQKQVDAQHEQDGLGDGIEDENASRRKGEDLGEKGGNAHVVERSDLAGILELDRRLREHLAEG